MDHLVYVVPDLDEAVRDLAERLGVRCAPGGAHPGRGSRNALLHLGGHGYLEVIGPDPQQPSPRQPRPFGMDALGTPRLVTWCIAPDDLDARVQRARDRGYEPGALRRMERRLPTGELLSWRLASNTRENLAAAGDGLVPFMIDWGQTSHPTERAPRGVRLVGLRGQHPRPDRIHGLLDAVGASLDGVEEGPRPALVATLATPRGTVQLH